MLYDPNWKKQDATKADPFALSTLIAWLEQQPEEPYNYLCNGRCLLGQYFTAVGFKNICMFTDCFAHSDRPFSNPGRDEAVASNIAIFFPAQFDAIAVRGERTFGAALHRARALKEQKT